MKKYDISDNFRERIHTVRVTFQYQEFKGCIIYEIGGNCRGLNVMDVDFTCMDGDDIDNLKENDCDFKFNYEYGVYELSLKDNEGNTCRMNDIEEDEINNYVVAVEIIDCRIDEEN